jgi:hypothetical protein
MMSVRDEAQTILEHLLYHQYLGVSKAFVFLDQCRDRTAEILAALPWVVALDRPRQPGVSHLTLHQNECAREALVLARREGFDWLLHIDPDEFAWGDNAASADARRDGSLLGLIERASPQTDLIRLATKEAVPVRGESAGPFWRQEYFQISPHILERDVLDPIANQMRRLGKWIGHNLGKSIVRTAAEVEPVSAHTWQRRPGDGGPLDAQSLGFHYHFVVGNASSWRAKYRKLAWEPAAWENGNPVPFPKQAWKDASMRFSDAEAVEYFERWIAIPEEQAKALVAEGRASRETRVPAVMDALRRDGIA